MPAELLCAEENLWRGTTWSVLEINWLANCSAGGLDMFANSN